jgi:diphosphomevalonate decarboxylase
MCFKIIQGTYKPKVSLPKFYISCLQQTILSLPYSHNIEGGEFDCTKQYCFGKILGKKDNQIPANPSVSFTLNNCKTITKLAFAKKESTDTFPLICF